MKRAIIVLLLLAVIAAGAGAWYVSRERTEIAVNTVPVTRGDIIDTVGATGTVQAVTTVQVGSQVSGNIEWLGADFNSIVKKGQVVARLDPSLFDAQLRQVQANLSQARANLTKANSELERSRVQLTDARQKYARAAELSKQSLIAQSDLDAAKVAVDSATAGVGSQQASVTQSQAAVTQAEASVNQSQVNRDHTIIMAPIDGIVTQRSVDVGQTVAASMSAPTLFVIAADLTEMQVNANIDEADVGRIRPGQRVTFRVDAYPTDNFEGTVTQIRLQPVVVQNVTTYGTVITVPNKQLKLKPGMTANVKIEIAKRTNAMRISNAALRFRPTAEVFTALKQEPPPEMTAFAGGGRGGRMAPGAEGPRSPAGPAPVAPAAPVARAAPAAPAARDCTATCTRCTRCPCRDRRARRSWRPRRTRRWRRWRLPGPHARALQDDVGGRAEGVPGPHGRARHRHHRVPGADAAGQGAGAAIGAPGASADDRRAVCAAAGRRIAGTGVALCRWPAEGGQPAPWHQRRHRYTELLTEDVQENTEVVTGVTGLGPTRSGADAGWRGQPADARRSGRPRPRPRRQVGSKEPDVPETSSTVIATKNLVKTYVVGDHQVKALRGVNLDVARGEFLSVTGPSGSGKSTFMHIVGCLDRPTSGQYLLDGQDVSQMSKNELAAVRNTEDRVRVPGLQPAVAHVGARQRRTAAALRRRRR